MIKVFTKSLSINSLFPTRVLSVQVLYAFTICRKIKSINTIKKDLIKFHKTNFINVKINHEIFNFIIDTTVKNYIYLDNIISTVLTNSWRMDKIPIVILSIFRANCCECIFSNNRNHALSICEYLQIAKSLNYQDNIKFIHAVIDNIAKHSENYKVFKNSFM